ncbi:MAG: hypothetical protein IKK33_15975 [Lachnospiraceae bacterium]|nr:hypothetical protein [Lachnospiraceae bacterium]
MKKKKIIIAVIVVILLLAGAVWPMIPRVKVYKIVREFSDEVFAEEAKETCEYFTDFNITYAPTEPIQTVNHHGITVDIPADWVLKETGLKAFLYLSPNEEECIIITEPDDLSFYSLLNENQIEELITDLPTKLGTKRLVKGFESLDIGMPDSGYNTMKAGLLLTQDSCSLFNLEKTIAHYIMCLIKTLGIAGEQHFIYETEDIHALYHIHPRENDYLSPIYADVFSPDDLNTCHTLVIKINSYERLYALMNSVRLESK